MALPFLAAGLGAGLGALGAFMGGSANNAKRKRLEAVANTPGLDIGQITGEALGNQQRYLPQATKLVGQEATSRQALINQLLEQSMPGFTTQRDQALGTAGSYLKGEIPADVAGQVQRSSAARALGGGYGGSGMAHALGARDLGLTSLNLQGQGLQWLTALRGLSPTATPQSAFGFTGPGAGDLANIRGQERSQGMSLRAQAAGIGGQTQAWANYLTQQGAGLQGAGMMGMGGGGGGGQAAPNALFGTMRGTSYQGGVPWMGTGE